MMRKKDKSSREEKGGGGQQIIIEATITRNSGERTGSAMSLEAGSGGGQFFS